MAVDYVKCEAISKAHGRALERYQAAIAVFIEETESRFVNEWVNDFCPEGNLRALCKASAPKPSLGELNREGDKDPRLKALWSRIEKFRADADKAGCYL